MISSLLTLAAVWLAGLSFFVAAAGQQQRRRRPATAMADRRAEERRCRQRESVIIRVSLVQTTPGIAGGLDSVTAMPRNSAMHRLAAHRVNAPWQPADASAWQSAIPRPAPRE